MNLKKSFLYAILTVILVVGAGLYVDRHSPKLVLPVNILDNNTDNVPNKNSLEKTGFQNNGPAPELSGLTNWLNSAPLTMSQLKGKVVLLDFWTYSCINCIRTLPYVTRWYDAYKNRGLVVIGVHTPEFNFEKEPGNVADAAQRFHIYYPVAQDNNYATWDAYQNRYWPAEYLVDQKGDLVYMHFGEGNYDRTENAIRQLLEINDEREAGKSQDNLREIQSPEMYFGTARLQNLTDAQTPSGSPTIYGFPRVLPLNTFALEGRWQFSPESAVLRGSVGKIRLKFHAAKVHIVAGNRGGAKLSVTVDGKVQSDVAVKKSQLYTLFDSADYSDHTMEITITGAEFQAFTFTFG